MNQAQIQIRLVVDEEGAARRTLARPAQTVAARRNILAGAIPPARDPSSPLAPVARTHADDALRRRWGQFFESYFAARQSQYGQIAALASAGVAKVGTAISLVGGDPSQSSVLRGTATGIRTGAIVAGGAKIVADVLPSILTALHEAIGLPFGKSISDAISEKLTEALTSLEAVLPAFNQAKEVLRGQIRLGGKPSIEYAAGLYHSLFFVEQQRAQLEASFRRDVNQELVAQLTRAALGR